MIGAVSKIEEIEEGIIEEFALFDDWMDKYEHIISLGKELPLIEESLKTEDLLIKGCQSRVWLHAKLQDGKVIFTADSDAIITKGIMTAIAPTKWNAKRVNLTPPKNSIAMPVAVKTTTEPKSGSSIHKPSVIPSTIKGMNKGLKLGEYARSLP